MVYAACILKHIPEGPHTLVLEEKSIATAMRSKEIAENLVKAFKPLAESQPYISECRMIRSDDRVQWRSGGFRQSRLHDITRTLLSAHLRHYNMTQKKALQVNTDDAWLTAEPSKE
ncbi:MAG TPA: hypothetical protein VJQ25_01505, partial [Nitrospira sp.]|nr:hypothetical protein [Nitrospira sp.]